MLNNEKLSVLEKFKNVSEVKFRSIKNLFSGKNDDSYYC
ncbi:hypothetical protein XNC3_110009 [Xenorhabdus nematophila F1]|nr:hypothetical protein XNC3_110009 [Xenorhabdus nematophila F1]CEE92300.1 hypothetical protein XNA1_2750001 [Xenorhabdus nematophila str. Anatoliense]CEK21826.1 protein of unknown function [Xenorhabdus nematophila AN6/1]